ncbi:MAG: hypothetical protein R3D62_05285 [Xanthobacteraceae bacterium]
MDVGDEKQQALRGRAGGRGGRLAAALRANLARRKEQGRARSRRSEETAEAEALEPPQSVGAPPAASHDSAEFVAEKSTGQAN